MPQYLQLNWKPSAALTRLEMVLWSKMRCRTGEWALALWRRISPLSIRVGPKGLPQHSFQSMWAAHLSPFISRLPIQRAEPCADGEWYE